MIVRQIRDFEATIFRNRDINPSLLGYQDFANPGLGQKRNNIQNTVVYNYSGL